MPINEKRFANRVALVTGCGSQHGIGYATAALLMKSGAGVAITLSLIHISEPTRH